MNKIKNKASQSLINDLKEKFPNIKNEMIKQILIDNQNDVNYTINELIAYSESIFLRKELILNEFFKEKQTEIEKFPGTGFRNMIEYIKK
jgi:hypothetical protein